MGGRRPGGVSTLSYWRLALKAAWHSLPLGKDKSQKGISLNSPKPGQENQLRVTAERGRPDQKGHTPWEGASLETVVGAGQERPPPSRDTILWGPERSPDETEAKGDHVRDSAFSCHPHFCLGVVSGVGGGRWGRWESSRMPESAMVVLLEAPEWPHALN